MEAQHPIAPSIPHRPEAAADHAPTSRDVILLWCLWLLGSWAVTVRMDSVFPASRWMMYACMTGLMVMWPAYRLSQDLPRRSAALVILRDWLFLNMVFQAVVWPLLISAGWSRPQAIWIDAAVAAWSGLTGCVLALGAGWRGGWQRAGAMALCLLILFGEPLLLALLDQLGQPDHQITWRLQLSPFAAMRNMTSNEPDPPMATILSVAAAACLGWLAVAFLQAAPQTSHQDDAAGI